jgi:hypothetical protein
VTVLRLIDGGEAGDVLMAHVRQEPLLLYPELDERGWRHRLLLTPSGAAPQESHVVLEIARIRK